MGDNSCKLTYDQFEAANKLYLTLPSWQIGDETFKYLKKQSFDDNVVCLLIVLAIDSLYSTSLRFESGLRERIAGCIHSERETLKQADEQIRPERVVSFAAQFKKKLPKGEQQHGGGVQTGPLSFASKFFHFFVCDRFPIYDKYASAGLKYACHALMYEQPNNDYCSFFHGVEQLRQLFDKASTRQLDQYLWLMGQWREELTTKIDGKNKLAKTIGRAKAERPNEITLLFGSPTPNQKDLLNTLTNGEYEAEWSSAMRCSQ
jgi:hypothetical protein